MQGADGILAAPAAGAHEVLIEGPLPARDTVQLVLPVAAGGGDPGRWLTLDGVHGDGVADANLQLSRSAPAASRRRRCRPTSCRRSRASSARCASASPGRWRRASSA
ncbi:MAG: hypothetical protein U0802_01995 [Candidatus Binatia bacterium]